jgi:hypothetical protein
MAFQNSQNPVYKCKTCMLVNATKRATKNQHFLGSKTRRQRLASQSDAKCLKGTIPYTLPGLMACRPGEKFHMDMGFVCGTKYSHKDEDGRLITSLDGYNSYLLIIDRATRYLWVFLSKFKTPKIDIVKDFLKKHGAKESHHKVIRTDEGGELRGSHSFQQAVREEGYILEQTASDSSFQNGMAERPNRTLGDIMRALLHGANLGPEYWSWAVLRAVYLRNRLPHKQQT